MPPLGAFTPAVKRFRLDTPLVSRACRGKRTGKIHVALPRVIVLVFALDSGRKTLYAKTVRYALVAQGIEHWPPEPGVAGSNPAERAIYFISGTWPERVSRIVIPADCRSRPPSSSTSPLVCAKPRSFVGRAIRAVGGGCRLARHGPRSTRRLHGPAPPVEWNCGGTRRSRQWPPRPPVRRRVRAGRDG